MENLLKKIEDLREEILNTFKLLDIERQEAEVAHLKIEVSKPDFWDRQEDAIIISKKLEDLDSENLVWRTLLNDTRELEELVSVASKEDDSTMDLEVRKNFDELVKRFKKLEFFVLFSGKYDKNNAIVSIHAGTGGVDAQDWAQILERMYLRFAEKMGWKAEIIDRNIANEAGIKNSSIHITGRWAFAYLKGEAGVHRLVRISPFDGDASRHTSFALVEVLPELPAEEELEIKESELRIDVFRSSGPGGQSVNTTDSAVRIVHLPTNITVICQSERSQHQNKERAMKVLQSKLLQKKVEERAEEESELKGDIKKAEWGKQIRSYVMQPYKMVKDHRTGEETQNIDNVLDGDLENFMEAYLRDLKDKNKK